MQIFDDDVTTQIPAFLDFGENASSQFTETSTQTPVNDTWDIPEETENWIRGSVALQDKEDETFDPKRVRIMNYQTNTYTMVSVLTLTKYFTCIQSAPATIPLCARKRRHLDISFHSDLGSELSGTEKDYIDLDSASEERILTNHSELKTTTTVTIHTTNESTRVSVSIVCTTGSMRIPPNC
ncbi:uncharacterized protein LOC143024280 [Oratosquilla oratoria]|uniref:uncharacterized protein LOC143024280 n=1 Tax=Oratosquilla oratoria TaxID=337810 RepID=UPI003F757A65